MPRIEPLPESEAADKTEQTYGRIREMLETDTVPEVFLPMGHVPAFLSDFYMNFKKFVWSEGKLDAKTRAIVAFAVCSHSGSGPWMDFLTERARSQGVTDEQLAEISATVAINHTYNAFFKFRAISGTDVFEGLPVALRAHTFANTSLDETTVELISIAISDLNVCQPCVSGHVQKARKLGLSDEAILETIQCAATMLAGIQFTKAANA